MSRLKLKMYFYHVFKELMGFYNKPFDNEWDDTLSGWLDDVEKGSLKVSLDSEGEKGNEAHCLIFTKSDFYKGVWISNKWFSYGFLYYEAEYSSVGSNIQFRPSIKNMLRLEELLIKLEKQRDEKAKSTAHLLYK